jgi:hypothetical protein
MVESHEEMTHIGAAVGVGMSDQVAEIVAAIERVLEYAPGDSNVVGAVLDIDIAIAAVSEGAVVNPYMAGFINADTIPIAYPSLVAYIQKPEYVVTFFAPEALQIAGDMRTRQADYRLVAPDADVCAGQSNIAADINDVGRLLGTLHVVDQISSVVDGYNCAACSACCASTFGSPADRGVVERYGHCWRRDSEDECRKYDKACG